MKVLLVGNYEPDEQKSMFAFSGMLERELPRLGCSVRTVQPVARVIHWPMPRRLRKWAGYVDKFVLFPWTLRRAARWADVVHICDHSNAMYVPRVRDVPNVLTCHDVIAIQAARGIVTDWQTGWSGRQFQRLIAEGIGQADLVVCVSQATEREVRSLDLVAPGRLVTVLNGLNGAFGPLPAETVRETLAPLRLAPDDRYLLHVGHEHPRKNRMAVLQAFLQLQADAAAAGKAPAANTLVFVGTPLTEAMQAQLAAAPGMAARVRVLEDMSHAQLRALYCGAVGLVFPSLQEGFGWPVIEAQACGCPVFTSDLAPLNEIGSAAAVYVDPRDPPAMARAIAAAAPRLPDMRRQGIDNAMLFAPGLMATRYVESYRRVVEAGQPDPAPAGGADCVDSAEAEATETRIPDTRSPDVPIRAAPGVATGESAPR